MRHHYRRRMGPSTTIRRTAMWLWCRARPLEEARISGQEKEGRGDKVATELGAWPSGKGRWRRGAASCRLPVGRWGKQGGWWIKKLLMHATDH
jgi:hypothetical protein